MSRKKPIDAIDVKILNLLQEDGRMSNKDLARTLGLSEGPTLTRVNNLRSKGVIETRSLINLDKLGITFKTLMEITIPSNRVEEFSTDVLSILGLLTCMQLRRELLVESSHTTFMLHTAHISKAAFLDDLKAFVSRLEYSIDYRIYEVSQYVKKSPTIVLSSEMFNK